MQLLSTPPPSLARTLGRGLLAGLGGTAVMTAVQLAKLKIQGGEPSMAPAKAVEKALHIHPSSERTERRLNDAAHFGYGSGWGLVRALLGRAGLHGAAASALHLGAVWGTALVMLPALDLAPSPREWGRKALASDLLQHAVYAFATGWIYDRLAHRARRRFPGLHR